jgi:hypothetical protein
MITLRQAVQEYLQMRRALGFKLHDAGKGLIDFVTFMEKRRACYITQALALAWAQQPLNVQPAHWASRLSFVRGFAQYRSATDPRTQIPAKGLLPFQPKRARPYLYSNAEIRELLHAALSMRCRYERGNLRPWIYYCMFGLLSVSGLRLGEARNLEIGDVDLKERVLTIRSSKFGKTRQSPPICLSPVGAIGWIAETSIVRFMPYPGRSDCAAHPTDMAHVCTTSDTDSRPAYSCTGIGPIRTPSANFLYCPPSSAMCMWLIHSGI